MHGDLSPQAKPRVRVNKKAKAAKGNKEQRLVNENYRNIIREPGEPAMTSRSGDIVVFDYL